MSEPAADRPTVTLRLATPADADAIAMAHVLHYNKLTIDAIRSHLAAHGIEVCRHDESVAV